MRKTILFAVACAALSAGGVYAKHGERDDGCAHDRHFRGHYRDDDDDDRGDDRDVYRHARELPPGLERQIERNGQLPPGLEKRMHPVPETLCRRMPPLPPGAGRGYYGGHVIVFDLHTSRIIDVFAGISIR